MRSRHRQRGFLLNPYRFSGSTQSGAADIQGSGATAISGAALSTATLSASGSAVATFASDQAASCALNLAGSATTSLVGAATATATANANGSGTATLYTSALSAIVDAADFDGTDDELTKGSVLTSVANSASGIFSCWIKLDTQSSFHNPLSGRNNAAFHPALLFRIDQSTQSLNVTATTTGGTELWEIISNSLVFGTGVWYHILMSWNAPISGGAHLYVNGVNKLSSSSGAGPNTVSYTSMDNWNVAGVNTRIDGGVAELYFAPGQFLDFSVQANREKFIDASGKPVNLGATGSIPTGTAPAIYLHLDDGETANDFAINRGTGGNFTVTGALTTYASSPSD
jgi:hypothetical protein